jgi:hypothetical protein
MERGMNQMIDVAAYEGVIGRKPRGYGLWRFVIGEAIYRHTGTFARAAKSAMAVALSCNERSIKLLPPDTAQLQ